MPELPPPKRQPACEPETARLPPAAGVAYAELHCRTNFSFLEGASHPDELVQTATALGYRALAITDRNSLAGVVRAHVAAKSAGLSLLIGAEVTPADAPPAVLLATDRAAYGRLCRLLTRGRRNAPKGECQLTLDDLAEHAEGLLACVAMKQVLAFRGLLNDERPAVGPSAGSGDPRRTNHAFREIFSDRCYALAELHHGPDDRLLLAQMQALASKHRLPLVAANDVHFHEPERQFLADVLAATRAGCTVAELGHRRFPNAERYLKSPAQMAALFAGSSQLIARTVEIADRCTFSMDELRYEYPEELAPPGMTPLEYLTRLTWEG